MSKKTRSGILRFVGVLFQCNYFCCERGLKKMFGFCKHAFLMLLYFSMDGGDRDFWGYG